jgi:hypothetical protein
MNTETNEFVDEWFEVSGERVYFVVLREVDFAVLAELALEDPCPMEEENSA